MVFLYSSLGIVTDPRQSNTICKTRSRREDFSNLKADEAWNYGISIEDILKDGRKQYENGLPMKVSFSLGIFTLANTLFANPYINSAIASFLGIPRDLK